MLHLLNPDRIVAFVLEIFARSLLLLSAACMVAPVFRRSSAAVRSLLWRLTLSGLAILPLLALLLPSLPIIVPLPAALRHPMAANTVSRPMETAPAATERPLSAAPIPEQSVRRFDSPTGSDFRPVSSTVVSPQAVVSSLLHRATAPWQVFVLGVWGGGTLLLLGRLAAALTNLRRVVGRSLTATGSLAEAAQHAAREIGVRVPVALVVSAPQERDASPMTWGALRPTLLLPLGTDAWPTGRLHAVLLHEMAHIARWDWVAGVVGTVACALFWPNPLAWIAARQMRRESEIACDDRVLDCGVRASEYAAHLLDIVKMRKNAGSLPCSAISMAEPSLIETRLRAALDPTRSRRPLSSTRRLVVFGLFVAALLPLAAAHITAQAGTTTPTHPAPLFSASTQPSADLPKTAAPGPTLLPTPSGPAPDVMLPQPAPATPHGVAGKVILEVPKVRHGNIVTAPLPPANPEENKAAVLKQAVWGTPSDGLEAGIRIPGLRRNFAVGERVPLECYLRNATDKEIALSFTALIYSSQLPVVHEVANPVVGQEMKGVGLRGIDPAFLLILKPHETVVFKHPGFVLGDKPLPLPHPNEVPKGLEQYPYLENPAAGNYTVQQPLVYHLSTTEEVHRMALAAHIRAGYRVIVEPFAITLLRPDGSSYRGEATTIPYAREMSRLTTGSAAFSIGSKEAAAARSAAVAAVARAQVGIAWGKASEGLQAGLRAPNGRTRYPMGSTVVMDYIVRNVSSKQIAFEHDVFPGVAGSIPDVLGPNGKPENTFGFPILHTSEIKWETLQPGEMVVVGQTAMGVTGEGALWYDARPGHITIKPTDEKTYTYLTAVPGRYRMRHLDTVVSSESGKQVLYSPYAGTPICLSSCSCLNALANALW